MFNQSISHQPVQSTDQEGFTLIEAVIAIAVLSIGILSVSLMQTGAVRGNARAIQITTASAWAGDRMERLNGLGYDDVLMTDTNDNGTGQDADLNGIDDDDEGVPVDSISNFGLDQSTTATADFTSTELPGFTMHYNVAVDLPVKNMKTLRIIIVRQADQQQFVFDYFKAAAL